MKNEKFISLLIEGNGIKGYIKRNLFKHIHACLCLINEKIEEQGTKIKEQENKIKEQENKIKEQENKIKEQENKIKEQYINLQKQDNIINVQNHKNDFYDKYLKKLECDLGANSRQTMLSKWKIIDALLSEVEHDDDVLRCKICGSEHLRKDYEIKETECIFNGGKLVRYVCPECGVIFGPTKFVSQGQQGIDEDYWVHYLGYSEGDSTYKEERAFFMLNPDKDKVYLNYGCGKWTKSLQKLREMGYQVYGYEPYAPEIDNPYLITDKKDLMGIKFDGIYSNDVLEHFIDPVDDMRFMKNLLRNKDSKMSHCTSCYVYKYEYTRFHTHFFTGNSVNILANRAGLKIIKECNDIEKNDFYCYVYKPVVFEAFNFISIMYGNDDVHIYDGKANIGKNGVMYGPYIKMFPSACDLHVFIQEDDVNNATLSVTLEGGKETFITSDLRSGENIVPINFDDIVNKVEFVIINKGNNITIDYIKLI